MKRFFTFIAAIAMVMLSAANLFSQNVGIATTAITPDASAMLEIRSTTTGLLIPRVALTASNAAGPVAAPANSLLVYNTATAGTAPNNVYPGYYYWETATSRWIRLLNNRDAWMTTGNNGLTETTNFLGNTDSIGVVFRTNNRERMRIDAHGRVGINISNYADLNILTAKGRLGYLLAGTVSITNGVATITGAGTSFLSNLSSGDIIYITDGGTTNEFNAIDTVNNNTSATCLLTFSVTDAACQIYVYPSTFRVTDSGENPFSTVIIDQIGDLGVGLTYPFGFGKITSYETAQYGTGVYSWVTNADANAVYGLNSAAVGTGANGDAIVGNTRQSGSAGGWFINRHTSGTGVMASGNNVTTLFLPAGSGGAFTGLRYGSYSVEYDSLTAGTGYTQVYAGAYGRAYFNRATLDGNASNINFYHFGVTGEFWNNSASRNGGRSGGVLGYGESQLGSSWGSLGYVTSTYANVGVYGSTAYATGAGKSMDQPATGFGVVGDGSLMGGLFHGDIYGLTASGERYGLFVDGKTYTNEFYSVISKTETDSYVPLYAPVSEKVCIYASGKGQIINGTAVIEFSKDFSELVSSDEDIVVTITPLGPSNGLYVSSTNSNGFTVNENTTNASETATVVDFNYIVIATRKGYENPSTPEELSNSSFYSGISNLMVSERGYVSTSTTSFWWDGSTIRFDEVPAGLVPQQEGFQTLRRQEIPENEQIQRRISGKYQLLNKPTL